MTATRTRRRAAAPEQARRRGLSALAVFVVGVVALIVLAAAVVAATDISVPNPFSETRRENQNAVVLAELREQSRYVAASGRFQTIIDAEQDADFLPDALKGSREIFIAEGDVDGWTEFSGLTEDAVQVSPEGDVLTVHVPPAQLGRPSIDTSATRLVSRERGIIDRIGEAIGGGDPTNQQALYQRAEQKIADAAAQSDLAARAEENTEKFLRSLFEGMGYREVKIVFDGPRAQDR